MTREELERLYERAVGHGRRYYADGRVNDLVTAVGEYLAQDDPTVEIAYLKAALADAKAERDALCGARPVAYLVVPTGYDAMVHSDKDLWTVRVELTDYQRDRWAVRHRNSCYSYTAPPSYEPLPSSRTDEWLALYRHSLTDALKLAKSFVDGISICGSTAQQASDEVASRTKIARCAQCRRPDGSHKLDCSERGKA